MDNNLQNLLNICQATQILNLSNLWLSTAQVQPVFRSLNHQASLRVLNLKGNMITDAGIKMLCTSLPSMQQLKELNLSLNSLTHKSLYHFAEMLSEKICLQELEELDISFNPLYNESFKPLANILEKLKLKKIVLSSCDLEGSNKKLVLPLNNIVWLDISHNSFQDKCIEDIFSNLDGETIEYLNLSNTSLPGGTLVEKLVAFLNASSLKSLTALDLSGCDISDTYLNQILHALIRAKKFHTFTLANNFQLSSISLRRLLQHRPCIKNIFLEGCTDILKYLAISNVYEDIDNLAPEEISMSVNKNAIEEVAKMDIIINMWMKLWGDQAVIKHGPFGELRLSTSKH